MRVDLARCAGALAVAAALVCGCATTPLGRHQLMLVSDADVESMGIAAYREMKKKVPLVRDPELRSYVECVARAVTAEAHEGDVPPSWEVNVFDDDQVNAFALPGGKIGVFRGLLAVADTPDELATVIGHEVAHVLARHSAERMSTALATEIGLSAVQQAGVVADPRMMALLGLGAEVGVILPFSRTQESEADLLGLDLMARAGFDPRASVELWRKMAAHGGEKPPELLSTHPADAHRIDQLRARLPHTLPLFERARAAGRRPSCEAPRHARPSIRSP